LIIGGGASAIEIAEDIANMGERVWISMRRPPRFVPSHVLGRDLHHFVAPLERALPKWLARRHCSGVVTLPPTDRGFRRLIQAGRIITCPPVLRFEDATAHFADHSSQPFDRVIAATGFEFRTPYLGREVARAEGGHLKANRGRSTTWPNLYVVGHPCSVDLASQFIRGIARDSQLVAEDIARA
jgi:thioredoxin reductase